MRSAPVARCGSRRIVRRAHWQTCWCCPQALPHANDRTAVRLVMIGGEARYGEPEPIGTAGCGSSWVEVRVDGCRKLLHAAIASRLGAHASGGAGAGTVEDRVEGGMTMARRAAQGRALQPACRVLHHAARAAGDRLGARSRDVRSRDRRWAPGGRSRRAPCCHTSTARCVSGVTVLTGAPISDALQISRAAKARAPRPARHLGWLASVDVCARVPGRSPPSMSPCADRAKRHSPRSCERLADGPLSRRLRRLHGSACRRHDSREPARDLCAPVDKFRAHDYGLIPVERYFRAQRQAPARLHLLAGLQFPLRVLLRSVRLRAQVGRARAHAHGAATEGAVGSVSLRRRQFPGRDLLHQARSGARRWPTGSSSRE